MLHTDDSTVPAALIAIRVEAHRLGWPIHWATDLDHDATAIATMLPREPFAWCLRACGTHLALARTESVLRMRMVAEAFRGNVCHFYVWNGHALETMASASAADDRLAQLASGRRRLENRDAEYVWIDTWA